MIFLFFISFHCPQLLYCPPPGPTAFSASLPSDDLRVAVSTCCVPSYEGLIVGKQQQKVTIGVFLMTSKVRKNSTT